MKDWMPKNPNRIEPEWRDSAYTIKISRIKHREFEDGCQQTARKLAEWLEEYCIHPHSNAFHRTHKDCKFCMEQLCKDVGL